MKQKITNAYAIIGLGVFISGCAWFSSPQNDQGVMTIDAPPQKVSSADATMPIVPPPANASGAAKTQATAQPTNQPRIQEDRENGVVNEIKVNNRNLPSYYIYPTQQQNYDYNRIPDENVTTPNWQISW
ncbi:MAG: hypothetical protein K0R14_111 [Burkholderiales bacterium]|jgi:hypothetical protein|nr:hypothetical protein [Burkholderiales bacterium]